MNDPAAMIRSVLVQVFQLQHDALPAELSVETIARWDSLGHLELVEQLEQTFHVRFAHSETVQLLSERAIIAAIAAKLEP